ncbi:MAG: cellulase family glycosylhydrolase [Ignavibacteriae bacterium]|nr:cellulase family glycosylhydrolase [Ignavibacteriota bacterium]
MIHRLVLLGLLLAAGTLNTGAQQRSTLFIAGRHLYTPCNERVVIRGVNKMIVWTGDLALRKRSYEEIAKTGANTVRIVWLANPSPAEPDAGPDGLDRTIQDCIDADLIPIIEVHDATGDWSKLGAMVDYWLRPEVLAVIQKHEKYLLLNIGNEIGDDTVTEAMFRAGYGDAILRLRNAGLKLPLVIDGSDWGKNIDMLQATGPDLFEQDPEHNILFSAHMYWAISDGATDAFITQELEQSAAMGLPLIVGEFAHLFPRGGPCNLETDYKAIAKACKDLDIGWLAWEWGPGNEFAHPSCDVMNMTLDGTYATLKAGWARDLALDLPGSIRQTSTVSTYIKNGGMCDPSRVREPFPAPHSLAVTVYPNPSRGYIIATVRSAAAAAARVSLVDPLGREVVQERFVDLAPGSNSIPFRLATTPAAGLYFVRVQTAVGGTTAPVLHLPLE